MKYLKAIMNAEVPTLTGIIFVVWVLILCWAIWTSPPLTGI